MTGALVRFAVVYRLADGRHEVSPTLWPDREAAFEQALALADCTSGPDLLVVRVQVPVDGELVNRRKDRERSAPLESEPSLLAAANEG